MSILTSIRCAALVAVISLPAQAQKTTDVPAEPMPPISRAVLHTLAVPEAGHEATLVRVDIAPNVEAGRHSHPGPVAAYVLYGSLEVEIDGLPVQRFAAGESFTVPAGAIHTERSGAAGASIVASFVLPPGAPMATPAK